MDRLAQLTQGFNGLGIRQKLAVSALGLGVLLMLVLGMASVNTPDYKPIYKNLTPTNAARIESTLSSAGFNALVSDDGGTISVPRSDMARARMILAETGLPIGGEAGWELFDEKSGLAMNSFLQQVNRLRAMEGELARSVQTLDGIQSARVHLVLPQREAFSRDRPDPRASVIVRSVAGRAITRKQAIAIRNLVASAVAELELGRVTVLSASGEVILAEGGSSSGQVTLQSTKAAIEDRMVREVEKILTARVGAGNARVSVNVELSSASERIVEQSYNPDQQVVRSTESKLEERTGSEKNGNVGVENNIPAALADPAGAAQSSAQSKSDEQVRYEIGNTRRETVREAGEVMRVSTAVLVNGVFSVDGSNVVYSERESEEIARLSELIKAAVGFDEARGDSISVDSFRFMDFSMEVGQPAALGFLQQIKNNIGSIMRSLITLVIVGVVMMFGIRPTLRLLTETQQASLAKRAEADALVNDVPEIAQNQSRQTAAIGSGQIDRLGRSGGPKVRPSYSEILEPEDTTENTTFVETIGVRGRLLKHRVDEIREVAAEKPEEALRVLRSWLAIGA